MSSTHSRAKARDAVTEWRVEKYFAVLNEGREVRWVTWIRLTPRTGRTHQIRVHLADLGHPVVGDKVYGFKRKDYSKRVSQKVCLDVFPRQVLHAEKLGLDHPRTRQALEFHAPLADDIRELLRNLGDA
jgi:23S rRNA pseudouridine1911/1915/1917 synthase